MDNSNQLKNKRFDSINGLRLLACFGIVLMHILSNGGYHFDGSIGEKVINEFTNFVFLFMVISSFGMCCGYFEEIKNNKINPEKFYSKRIKKVLPFFLTLVLADIVVEHNTNSIIEGFSNITLMFGFLQKELSVLGVAWFLGLIFIFYFMFPFFTFLFGNKKRAIIVTLAAIIMNYVSMFYFDIGRTNMFYSFIYFCIGGLVYLYKDNIINLFKNSKIIGLLFVIISTILYFAISVDYLFTFKTILVSIALLSYAISYESKMLDNKITKFIGNISLEIYLCHMLVFRVVEKLHLLYLFKNYIFSYVLASIIILIGAIIIAVVFRFMVKKIEEKVS